MAEVAKITASTSWGWFLAHGLASVLLGWLLLAKPVGTVISLAVWFGFYLLVTGIIGTISSFMDVGHKGSYWGWKLAAGVFSIIVGLFVLNNVLFTAVMTPIMFMYVIAFSLIINGIATIIAGREDFKGERNWTWGSFVLGALYIILGVMLLGADTFTAISTLVKVGGWALVAIGFSNIIFSFMIKKEA